MFSTVSIFRSPILDLGYKRNTSAVITGLSYDKRNQNKCLLYFFLMSIQGVRLPF